MPDKEIAQGSLVLYRGGPAIVRKSGDRLEIELQGGKTAKVRLKDVSLLHPGPLQRLDSLVPQEGDPETAWEILAGGETSLPELAELAFGDFTPASAWAAWQLVEEGLYFRGDPQEVQARSPEQVEDERAARNAAAAEGAAWSAFLERARERRLEPEDSAYVKEVEEFALEQREKCRALRELGRSEEPENAHALLLELKHWDETVVPYAVRSGMPAGPPAIDVPELPEEDRVDLTHLPAFAIDDEGCSDPDDALSLDGQRLWVHVADAASVVAPDGELDLEARARGANLYLPDGVTPMLPFRATEILGLGLSETSPALSFGIDFGESGEVLGAEVVTSRIRVTRVTYEEAEERMDEDPFKSLFESAQTFSALRQANGAVTVDLPETRVAVEDGRVTVRPLPPLRSRSLVQEAMLMAGVAAARFAAEHEISFPFSTQEPPEQRDRPEGLAGSFSLRRSLKRSQLRSVPAPHAGLGLESYAQCTSPLRRYLDLVAHQQLRAYLRGGELIETQEMLERVGAAEAVTAVVKRAERLSLKHWTLVYLMQNPDWQGEGLLVGQRKQRGTVVVPELGTDFQVYLHEDLPLNSPVSLRFKSADLPQLEAFFQ